MKKLTVFVTLLLVFYSGHTQRILSGIYSGSMYNDSTRMLQKYELALSEYRGKVMGYSYVTFIVNDTFYYGIRRVKGFKNENNELVLTDEELLANNFPESPAKRVRRTAIFPLAQEDTITSLKGTWQTNRTRQFYSVGGATKTERSADSSQSALVAHLKELKIIAGQPDYQDGAVAKSSSKVDKRQKEGARGTTATEDKRAVATASAAADRNVTPKNAPATIAGDPVAGAKETAGTTAPRSKKREASSPSGRLVAEKGSDSKTEAKPSGNEEVTTLAGNGSPAVQGSTTKAGKAVATGVASADNPAKLDKAGGKRSEKRKEQGDDGKVPVAAAVPANLRSTTVIKTLEVAADSITLSFYDNGVVDGDVISVFVNGEKVIEQARLNEVAVKKVIHLTKFADDSVEVTLVAETLGSIPPNTGLVLVFDGDKRYDVRFAADLQNNASIVFRKGKK